MNAMVTEYQQFGNEEVFNAIYRYYYDKWKTRAKLDARKIKVDEEDILSYYSQVLYQTVKCYDASKGDFNSMVRCAIINAKKTMRRDNASRVLYESPAWAEERDDDDDGIFLSIPDEDALSSEKTREQRELLSYLTANMDDLTRKIVTLFGKGYSYNSIGKRLRMDHKRVKRKIQSLSRRYDGNRFGDIRDYLYA